SARPALPSDKPVPGLSHTSGLPRQHQSRWRRSARLSRATSGSSWEWKKEWRLQTIGVVLLGVRRADSAFLQHRAEVRVQATEDGEGQQADGGGGLQAYD